MEELQKFEETESANNALSTNVFKTAESFALAQRQGKMLATSSLIPKQFQGKEADCILAVEMSARLGASPLAVLQNLYIVHGKPAWSAAFMIAMVNACGRFEPLQFKESGEGDEKGVQAWTKTKDGEVAEGPLVTIAMAKKEGWFQKTGSKWQTMPDLMLRYRAGTFFARLYAPDLMLGMQTKDEVGDLSRGERKKTESTPINMDHLKKAVATSEPETVEVEVETSDPEPAQATTPTTITPRSADKPMPPEAEERQVTILDSVSSTGEKATAWTVKMRIGRKHVEAVTFSTRVGANSELLINQKATAWLQSKDGKVLLIELEDAKE